jgi:hypothetical protein
MAMSALIPEFIADQIGTTPFPIPKEPFELNPVLLRVNTGGAFLGLYSLHFCSNSKRENHQTVVGGASRIDYPARKPSQHGFLHDR